MKNFFFKLHIFKAPTLALLPPSEKLYFLKVPILPSVTVATLSQGDLLRAKHFENRTISLDVLTKVLKSGFMLFAYRVL